MKPIDNSVELTGTLTAGEWNLITEVLWTGRSCTGSVAKPIIDKLVAQFERQQEVDESAAEGNLGLHNYKEEVSLDEPV